MAVYESKIYKSKDGRNLVFRSFDSGDAQNLQNFMQQIATETTHTMQYSERKLVPIEQTAKRLEDAKPDPLHLNLGVFHDDKIVGYLNFRPLWVEHPWVKHLAQFGMMILRDYWGLGIGRTLLEIQDSHAKKNKVTRIEAMVRTSNRRGVNLYLKNGFKIEGKRKQAAFINDSFHDEYFIAKIFEDTESRSKNYFSTPELLSEMIDDGIQSNVNYHDDDYSFMLSELWKIQHQTTLALKNCVDGISPSRLPDKQLACLMMLTNCLVDCHSVYQSMRQGFHRAAAITARGMLENMALAVLIHGDESDDVFNQYKNNTYDIPKAIGPASKFFKHIGKLYGLLSSKFAHEPFDSIGRAVIQNGKTTTILLVPPVSRNEFLVQFVLLSKLGLLICMLGEVIEWTFVVWKKPELYWDMVENGQLKTKENPAKNSAKIMTDRLEALMKMRSGDGGKDEN